MGDVAPPVVNLADKLALFSDHWNPRIVGHYNGNEVRVSKLKGEFIWHSHAETDELFLVLEGDFTVETDDGRVTLAPGEMVIVPKGTRHRPVVTSLVKVMQIELEGTLNKQNSGTLYEP